MSDLGTGDPGITVYWRPGCGYCSGLFRQLDRLQVPYRAVDIWQEPEGAAFVRSVARGNETVPTVAIGSVALVNPSAMQVVDAAATHAPSAVPRDSSAR
jgi:mycoredoxin